MKFVFSICIFLIGLSVTAQDDFWKEEIDRNNDVAWDIAESNTVKAYQISYQVNAASKEKNSAKALQKAIEISD